LSQELHGFAEHISWSSAALLKSAEFSAEKLTYIELRVDKAQSTCRDVLRHLFQHITEYDSEIGDEAVLSSWLVAERDTWLLRRSYFNKQLSS